MTRCYVIMGVSGCGKSTVGQAVADACEMTFVDGDDLHPKSNIVKMSSGRPLDDHDRQPWLEEVGRVLAETAGPVVLGCSALKRAYRDIIRARAEEPVCFIHLDAAQDVLARRLNARANHFMPATLLDSQYAALEPLDRSELGQRVDIARPVAAVIKDVQTVVRKNLQ